MRRCCRFASFIVRVRTLAGFEVFEDVGVEDGRGDLVGSAGPLTEVDLAAAVAAEGEVFVGRGDDGLAGWATEDDWFCFGTHWCVVIPFLHSIAGARERAHGDGE